MGGKKARMASLLHERSADSLVRVRGSYLTRTRLSALRHCGYFSNFGTSGLRWSHGCASEAQILYLGRNQLGSSRLAAWMPMNCGAESNFETTGEPHSGQKPRCTFPPRELSVRK